MSTSVNLPDAESTNENANESTETHGESTNETTNGSTEARRPPQQYTGQARTEILRKLKREVVRFRTFQNWQSTATHPNDLAKAGFFYFNMEDRVQCAFCLGIIGQWNPEDNPRDEHSRHLPRCPFILGLPVGNIPINPTTGRELQTTASTGPGATTSDNTTSRGAASGATSATGSTRPYTWESSQIETFGAPAMPSFITRQARLQTLKTWPRGLAQKPQQLAEAGLYYTGVSDKVRCYHCDGGLGNWEPTDEPWTEHAKHYPECKFVILVKGKEFTRDIQKQKERKSNVIPETAAASTAPEDEALAIQNPVEPHSISTSEPPRLTCQICMNADMNIVILPCSHLCACSSCVAQMTKCPICRGPIKGYVKTFLC